MSTEGASLLNFLDAPVVVGDPEGRVIFVNPAFSESFAFGAEATGCHFAELFQGGGREAFLRAVAEVCQTGETVRFRLREDGRGYIGVASPIEAEANRVGVLILLSDEPFLLQRLAAVRREIGEPLDELSSLLDELAERASASGLRDVCTLAESALQATERARKSMVDLQSMVEGQSPAGASHLRFEPVKMLRAAEHRISQECALAGVALELLVPDSLPPAIGDGDHLETVLLRMVRDRVQQCDRGDRITLSLRRASLEGRECAVFSLVAPAASSAASPLLRVRDSIAALGGFRHVCLHTTAGRVTVVPLPLDI